MRLYEAEHESAGFVRNVTSAQRVLQIPIWNPPEVDLTAEFRRPGGAHALNLPQSQCLWTARQFRGLFGPIGVGHGKTLICLLFGAAVNAERTVVMIPAHMRETFGRECAKWSRHFYIPRIEVLAYTKLSRDSRILDKLAEGITPGRFAVICDEAHKLCDMSSARTKRLMRFAANNPSTVWGFVSGTFTQRSISEYAHLAELALREYAPFPTNIDDLQTWAKCVDLDGRPGPLEWQRFKPLWDWVYPDTPIQSVEGAKREEMARKAYYFRFKTAPGVVMTSETSIGTSLYVDGLNLGLPAAIKPFLEYVKGGNNPEGLPFESDIEQIRCERQLSLGFFYRFAWEQTEIGEPDSEWLETRSEWSRCLRAELRQNAAADYDSPSYVENRIFAEWCANPELANPESRQVSQIHFAYARWYYQKHKPQPPTVPVWIDDTLIQKVVEWVKHKRKPFLVWYLDQAVGDKLESLGLPRYGGGVEIPDRAHTCAVSISAHSTGKNLQRWSHNLVLTPPSNGKRWEQLIARTHRQGQDADEVWVWVLIHTQSFARAMENGRSGAEYIEQITGQRQKLNFATLSGIPSANSFEL